MIATANSRKENIMNEDEIFGALIEAQSIKERMYTIECEVEEKGGVDYKGAWGVLKAVINDHIKEYEA